MNEAQLTRELALFVDFAALSDLLRRGRLWRIGDHVAVEETVLRVRAGAIAAVSVVRVPRVETLHSLDLSRTLNVIADVRVF